MVIKTTKVPPPPTPHPPKRASHKRSLDRVLRPVILMKISVKGKNVLYKKVSKTEKEEQGLDCRSVVQSPLFHIKVNFTFYMKIKAITH